MNNHQKQLPITTDQHFRLLARLADQLLSRHEDDGRLLAVATELYALLSSVSGLGEQSEHPADSSARLLTSGKAISPKDAARCVLDHVRTSKFLKGTHDAIVDIKKRFPGTTVEILYAGCGPFAALAVPLATCFAPGEVRFTLLDIHERSLEAAKRIFQGLGISAYVRKYVQSDATEYKHSGPYPIHIILTESMQAALATEPEVAMMLNLAPQLCTGGIFIPEQIAIDCYLCDLCKEFCFVSDEAGSKNLPGDPEVGRVRIHLGRVLELTSATAYETRSDRFAPVILKVPMKVLGEFHLMLSTSITIFNSVVLNDYQSGLTAPKVLHDLGTPTEGAEIEFVYELGARPGFRYRLL